jgi:hypothetical protein
MNLKLTLRKLLNGILLSASFKCLRRINLYLFSYPQVASSSSRWIIIIIICRSAHSHSQRSFLLIITIIYPLLRCVSMPTHITQSAVLENHQANFTCILWSSKYDLCFIDFSWFYYYTKYVFVCACWYVLVPYLLICILLNESLCAQLYSVNHAIAHVHTLKHSL